MCCFIAWHGCPIRILPFETSHTGQFCLWGSSKEGGRGERKDADAVIKAAKEGFVTACSEGGTRHWFTVGQLLMALDPANEGLTFCNAWMIQNAKACYFDRLLVEGKVMATLEKSAKDLIVPSGTGIVYRP